MIFHTESWTDTYRVRLRIQSRILEVFVARGNLETEMKKLSEIPHKNKNGKLLNRMLKQN